MIIVNLDCFRMICPFCERVLVVKLENAAEIGEEKGAEVGPTEDGLRAVVFFPNVAFRGQRQCSSDSIEAKQRSHRAHQERKRKIPLSPHSQLANRSKKKK